MQSYSIKTIGGGTIRQAREELGYTQREVAEVLRVSTTAVSQWENETRNILEQHWFPLLNLLRLTDVEVQHR